jgi:hypothetical protein
MKISSRRAVLESLCLAGVASGAFARQLAVGGSESRFTVFDGLLYKPMPDLRSLGMPKLLAIGNTWRPGVSHDEVDPAGIADALHYIQRLTTDAYFDLEEWTLYGQPADAAARIQRHLQVAEIARETTPGLKFGFYGVVPTSPYWPILLNKTDMIAAWRAMNRRSRAIADKVDYLFPSLYTFYNDPRGWETNARAVLKEARQLGKPVYPFLWPEFHDSNAQLKFQQIPAEFWRRELEVCRECADGLVLWGGFKEPWDEEAPWWLETRSFVNSLHTQQQLQPTAARFSRT